MGCLAIIVLTLIGSALLGPWGGAAGFLIGVMVAGGMPKKIHLNALGVAFLQCMAKIAKSDGRVSEREAALIGEFIRRNYPESLHAQVRKVFNAARDDQKDFSFYCDQFAELALRQLDDNSRRQFLYLFCSLAASDGEVSDAERVMLDYAENALRLRGCVDAFFRRGSEGGRTDADGERFGRRAAADLEAMYRLLECEPDCDETTLKKAYRKKCADFHPDRLQGKGLPKQFLDYAEEQMKAINQAYDTICRARGVR